MRIHGSTNEKNSLAKLMVNFKDLKRIESLHFSQIAALHLKQWGLLKLYFLSLSSAPLNVSLFKQVYCMQVGHPVSSPWGLSVRMCEVTMCVEKLMFLSDHPGIKSHWNLLDASVRNNYRKEVNSVMPVTWDHLTSAFLPVSILDKRALHLSRCWKLAKWI